MSEETVVEYSPIKRVVVHDATYLDSETLLISMAHGTPVGQFGRSLVWTGGIAFAYSVLPWNDKTIDLYLDGEVHINSIVFTAWPSYKAQAEVTSSKGGVLPGIRVPIWDVSNQPQMVALVKFLKRYMKETEAK